MRDKKMRTNRGCFSIIFLFSFLPLLIGLIVLSSALINRFIYAYKFEPTFMKVTHYENYYSGVDGYATNSVSHKVKGYLRYDSLYKFSIAINDFPKLKNIDINVDNKEDSRYYHDSFRRVFDSYLIKNDSLIPVWTIKDKNSNLFRYEAEGQVIDIKGRYLNTIWLGIGMILPFLICTFFYFLNIKNYEKFCYCILSTFSAV